MLEAVFVFGHYAPWHRCRGGGRDEVMGERTTRPAMPHDASELAAGYTVKHRRQEYCGISLAVGLSMWLAILTFQSPSLSGWWMPLAALVGILASDFVSGFVHWLFDTWGNL